MSHATRDELGQRARQAGLPVFASISSLLWGSLCACQGDEGDGTDSANGGTSAVAPLSGEGDPRTLVGTFQVKVTPASGATAAATSVFGKVYDGETPSTLVWENPQQEGDCTLTTPRVPFCDNPCGGSAACVEDDTCEPYPAPRSVGEVSVTGLRVAGGGSFVMDPVVNNYQPPAGTRLEYPPFGEGDAIEFAAAGEYFAGFTLDSRGVLPLALDGRVITLRRGEPLALDWTAGSASDATIHVKLDISHHGGTKGQIECDTSDGGHLEISAELVASLIDLGVAGYPSVIVTRHVTGSALIAAGRVDLEIASVVERSIDVEGLMSCTADAECPQGQTCQSDNSCR